MKKSRSGQPKVKLASLETNTSSSTNTSTRDKLVFTAFVALIVHLVVILGVSFSAYSRNKTPPTIQVTLAQHADNISPDRADYLAQHNQEASGTLEKKAELTTDKRADFSDTAIREVEPDKQKPANRRVFAAHKGVIAAMDGKRPYRADQMANCSRSLS